MVMGVEMLFALEFLLVAFAFLGVSWLVHALYSRYRGYAFYIHCLECLCFALLTQLSVDIRWMAVGWLGVILATLYWIYLDVLSKKA